MEGFARCKLYGCEICRNLCKISAGLLVAYGGIADLNPCCERPSGIDNRL